MLWRDNSHRLSSLIFPALSAILLILNIALTIQNRALKAAPRTPASLLPSRGARVEEIGGLSLDGARIDLRFGEDHRKTMLFVFSTVCGVCKVNWPNWQELGKSADSKSFRLIYANINSTMSKEYIDKYGLSTATVLAQVDPRSRAALNLQVTPLTILLRADGTVERFWTGALKPEEMPGVRKLISGQ